MVGPLPPSGDALLGQDLAQPGVLVVHVSFPSCISACLFSGRSSGSSLASSGWRCGVGPESGTFHTPALARSLSLVADPIGAAVPLRPIAGDNPGEMGGHVASPTFVGRTEEQELLEAARVRAADGVPAVVLMGARPVSARPAWLPS
jgi:hypothetical protein